MELVYPRRRDRVADRHPRIVSLVPISPPLLPLLPSHGPIPDDVDAALTVAAISAQRGDIAARNALYFALEPKIGRIVRRCAARLRCRPGALIEPDDIAQEAFVLLADLIARWPGHGSFVAYFLVAFPRELHHAARRSLRGLSLNVPEDEAKTSLSVEDESANAETIALVEDLIARLDRFDREILVRRGRDGDSFTAIARDLGVSRRTVHRRWSRLRSELRLALRDGSEELSVSGQRPR
ncbi:MAG TPA: sigma-70 family RNA polymerase sigma factor [Thermomicrobiales bacterium]